MASSFPLIGKHRHVQRRILSFLRPTELRIARYVFRDCPLPQRPVAEEWSEYAQSLMEARAYSLLAMEVTQHGMRTNRVIETAFETSAPTQVIVFCALNMHASLWNGDVEQGIAKYERHDVLDALDKRAFMWNRYQLCAAAWLFDSVPVLKLARHKMQADKDFANNMWSAISTELDSVPFSEGIIPVEVLTVILNAGVLDGGQSQVILRQLLEEVSSQVINRHVKWFENRLVAICGALRFSGGIDVDPANFEVTHNVALWNRMAAVVWPN